MNCAWCNEEVKEKKIHLDKGTNEGVHMKCVSEFLNSRGQSSVDENIVKVDN